MFTGYKWRAFDPPGRTEDMAVQRALAMVREAPLIVDVLQAADDVALAAARDGGRRAAELLTRAIEDPADELTAIAAVHALGRVFDDEADAVLSELLSHERAFLREHASWALAGRLPRLDAIGRLIAVITTGGFPGMLAQRTLGQWARSASDHVALALEGAIAVQADPPIRARLVETLGLVPGALAERSLLRIAADAGEAEATRIVAVGALGDRGAALPEGLAFAEGELGAVARLAALDLDLARTIGGGFEQQSGRRPERGVRVAQLFLHADIDRELTRSGMGDNGGVATLLLRLGDALAATAQVSRVLTLSRGTAAASVAELTRLEAGPAHQLSTVPLLRPPTGGTQAWPARVAAERGIRRALLAHAPVDVLHLRMADVGSMAAETVAHQLGIPVVFTLAPDPHAVIHSLDLTGALTRAGFGAADEQEHYWFRARLVQRLAANSAHNVLFPRPDLKHDLRELLGIEVADEPHRYTVVPEGIDLAVSRAARADVAEVADVRAHRTTVSAEGASDVSPGAGGAVSALLVALADLPAHRQGLPIAISVGRLHRVKGMASVVEAWAGDPALLERCNLVIVGGDLEHPSPDEQDQLDRIRAVVPTGSPAAAGLVLAGHQPNDVVARWLAVAEPGLPPFIGPGGVYVCGSLKEEFGLAVVEAMAAGLVVVAPDGGGPATYVEPGVTGLLVNTRVPAAIGAGLHAALDLAVAPGREQRQARTAEFLDRRLTVQAMARSLATIYTEAAAGPRPTVVSEQPKNRTIR
jgi:glycosyltransferase involved in cell wall biosynthesis